MDSLAQVTVLKRDLGDNICKVASTLCEHLAFDAWKIIIFNEDKVYGYVQYSSEMDLDHLHKNQSILISSGPNQNPYLNKVLTEKRTIFHKIEDVDLDYNPIDKDALAEIYFPILFEDDIRTEVVGCLYFSKNGYPKNDLNRIVSSEHVNSSVLNIRQLVGDIYEEYIQSVSFFNLIHIFSEVIEAREPFMKRHPYNVAFLSSLIGQKLKLSANEHYKLYMAAILHDIGKVFIPDPILGKQGRLSKQELAEIQRHPVYSYNIVKDLTYRFKNLSGVAEIVLHHHERYDGEGYPAGISGENIPLESRVLAVADSVDAMLSDRSYKKTKSINDVIADLIYNKGRQFDPKIAQIMIDLLVNKQETRENILTRPITIGSLEILTRNKSCQLQGVLMKTNLGYKFKADCTECLCDECDALLPDIISASYHIENNERIYEYEAKVVGKTGKDIYISKLAPRASSNYFSLLWELGGILRFKQFTACEVTINKIGGDFLSFYADAKILEKRDVLDNSQSVIIQFEDGTNVQVLGKVIKQIKVGFNIYCDFKYTNILESTRDEIFRQIFKKQVEFRKDLFTIMAENR